MEVRGAGQFGDGDLAGVDEVAVDLVSLRGRAHAEHPVLRVEGDVLFLGEVVGHERRLADAQVHE
ncbi:hypothetical protein D3C73_1322240 [compost metagenome]